MSEHRFWIIDPAGHRQREHEQAADLLRRAERVGVPTAGADMILIPPGNEFVCDRCNIELDTGYPIPVIDGYALCAKHAREIEPDGKKWGGACDCPACQYRRRELRI